MRRLALAALVTLAATAPPTPIPALSAISVPLDADDPARVRLGRLAYRGGIAISAPDRRVGGISGMRFLADGRLLAITDAGDWLTLTLAERGGRLNGVAALGIARMVGANGDPLRGKAGADAEALELDTDGTPFVAYERDHRVMRFPAGEDRARAVAFPDREWLAKLPANEGIEAMARLGDAWLFLAEGGDAAYSGVLLSRRGVDAAYGRVAYRPPEGFKPTDAAALDDDHVLVLNRRYSPIMGVAATLVLLPVDRTRLTLGAAETLAEFRAPVTVDNMEALAVHREGGRVYLYIASDDNFSPLQRTLLLKFELLPR